MKTVVLLSYTGLGSNLLHLSYCHQIAKKFGPVTIITLCENLSQALSKDPLVREVIYLKPVSYTHLTLPTICSV